MLIVFSRLQALVGLVVLEFGQEESFLDLESVVISL